VIAAGFAVAAVTMMLVDHFGHVIGYWLMAGGLVAIGVVAAILVSFKEHEEQVAEEKAQQTDTQEVFTDATSQALTQMPLALLGALSTTRGGATSALKLARILGRNFPLVLLLGMIGALFWPTSEAETSVIGKPEFEPEPRPNGFKPAEIYH
jgi:Na+/melibiose symporter-like transporter